MKRKIYPKGFCAILYVIFSILCSCSIVLYTFLLLTTENKNELESLVSIILMLSLVLYKYLLYSSIRIVVEIDNNKLKVKGQPIRYKNRIQHSFSINIDEINKISINFDEYNSKGEKFSSLNPRHEYQDFIYFKMNDGKIYKIWIKHFSEKQINEIIHIKEIEELKWNNMLIKSYIYTKSNKYL